MMKNLLLLVTILSLGACVHRSTDSDTTKTLYMTLKPADYTELHAIYREPALTNRRFKHSDIDSLIKEHKKRNILRIAQIGQSVEQRSIYSLSYGGGKKKVMLWSQMHGDEPTATMALFDLFNFLEGKENDDFDSVRTILKAQLELLFIPMLNPDGAERYMRRNAQYIDLNRDARDGQSVEGALLRQMAKSFRPAYGFNLHDQQIYYNVPDSSKPVSISFLAPAYNYARETNAIRHGAMQIIVGMNQLLQSYIPGAVAKYDDTHTPRGFGDNFQAWGARTVLIESGGMRNDTEKQEIRKLNFAIILHALLEIAQDSYKEHSIQSYEQIPFNASQMHDVVIRNVDLGTDSIDFITDVAIRRYEVTVGRDYFVQGRIEDIGDLDDFFGYQELDAEKMEVIQGKTFDKVFQSIADINIHEAWDLLKKGYIAVKVKEMNDDRLHTLPLVVFTQQRFVANSNIVINGTSNFFLGYGNTLKYAVVNGYLIDLTVSLKEERFKNRVN